MTEAEAYQDMEEQYEAARLLGHAGGWAARKRSAREISEEEYRVMLLKSI